jgi:hypothetical protein
MSCSPLYDSSCHENICNVCFEPLGKTNCTTTPCGHEFCFKCIIQAYQRNPICPCCRAPFNDEEKFEQEDEDYEEDEPRNWRHGRDDLDGYYHFPEIIETIEDFDSIMRTMTGGYNVHARIRTMIKLIDKSCKFGEGEENRWEDECAEEESESVKELFDIYKRTQLIKRFANTHIKNQSLDKVIVLVSDKRPNIIAFYSLRIR